MNKRLAKKFTAVLVSAALTVLSLTGCSIDILADLLDNGPPLEEQLLSTIPVMDASAYNRFAFRMDVTAGNMDGIGESFAMTGTLETKHSVAHMYNLNIYSEGPEYESVTETWTDSETDESYIESGKGWRTGAVFNDEIMDYLVDAIGSRDTEMILNNTDTLCTLSWTFPIDSVHLFGETISRYTGDMELDGYGRITAVFHPETYEFQYFTIIASTSNKERASALLDAIFYWDAVNSHEDALVLPIKVACEAYEASTGVMTDGGYDDIVNPMAEEFIDYYGGIAEVVHYEGGASMFWTLEDEGTSAAVNFARTDNPKSFYEESRSFLTSFYGSSAEESDDAAYFYNSDSGELMLIAEGNDWYAEIIITAEPGTSQGTLRKSLITYKAKLGI